MKSDMEPKNDSPGQVYFVGLYFLFGQIIAASHDLIPNGGLVREISYFREIQVCELL